MLIVDSQKNFLLLMIVLKCDIFLIVNKFLNLWLGCMFILDEIILLHRSIVLITSCYRQFCRSKHANLRCLTVDANLWQMLANSQGEA